MLGYPDLQFFPLYDTPTGKVYQCPVCRSRTKKLFFVGGRWGCNTCVSVGNIGATSTAAAERKIIKAVYDWIEIRKMMDVTNPTNNLILWLRKFVGLMEEFPLLLEKLERSWFNLLKDRG